MFRKYLLLLLLTVGLTTLPGCSLFSSDNEEGETTEEISEDGEVVESEGSSSDVEVSDDSYSESSGTEELALNTDEEEVVDEYPDDDYGGESTASSDLPDQPMGSTSGEETLYVQGDDSTTSSSDETSSYSESSSSSSDTLVDSSSSGASAGFVPVKKMKRTPYNDGGVLLNRIYIARSGDNLSSVAEKIYGDSSRKRDLAAWNSSLSGRSLKVGDKVYYNSPRNPSDSSQILTYYEDVGMQPQYYTAKSGDSIRKVSQDLLGHPRSWMEVWATNEVDSKWEVPAGTSLRYWPDGGTPAPAPVQQQAAVEDPAPPPQEMEQPMDEQPMDDPGQNVAMNDGMGGGDEMPPPSDELPPPDDMGAGATVAQNEEPPPPPPSEMAPPPPPSDAVAPPEAPGDGGMAALMGGEDDTTMMIVLGGLLIVAVFILLIFLKRGRKKVNYS